MTKLVAIDNKNHRNLKVDASKAELHGAQVHLIPAVLPEFTNLAAQYPLVLTKNGDTGQFVCVAMLGFEANENLFWQDGQWQAIYLPLQIQRQPFFVGDADSEQVVCIDLDSPTLSSGEGETLFADDGTESEYFRQAKERLAHLLHGESVNQSFIEKIIELELLQPLSLEITFVNQTTRRLNGLYTIDKSKLAALAGEQVLALHQSGYLEAIYTMITSLGQIYALIDKKNKRLNA